MPPKSCRTCGEPSGIFPYCRLHKPDAKPDRNAEAIVQIRVQIADIGRRLWRLELYARMADAIAWEAAKDEAEREREARS
jgi:hypothetical protein